MAWSPLKNVKNVLLSNETKEALEKKKMKKAKSTYIK